jgi:hypothetical protein
MILMRRIIVLFICLATLSCSNNSSIIGRWKQLENEPYDSIPNYKAERVLTIAIDSSFTFDDGTAESTDTSVVPGWHTGGAFSGRWRMPDKKHLELRMDPQEPLMILNYEVIKLTDKELELIFPAWRTMPEVKPLRYTRL